MQLINMVRSFIRRDEGQDLLEYALLVALIAIVAAGAVELAGGSVSAIFTDIAGQLDSDPLGPIDIYAWGAGALGIVLGLGVVWAFVLATTA